MSRLCAVPFGSLVVLTLAIALPATVRADDTDKKEEAAKSALPSYELAADATLEETLKFVQDLKDFVPNNQAEALQHRAKGRAALMGAIGRVVELSEKEGKTNAPIYLEAKREMLRGDVANAEGVEKARAALLRAADFLAAREKIATDDSRMAVFCGYYYLRTNDDSQEGQDAFAAMVAALRKSDDPAVLEDVERVEGLARRAVLIGKTVDVKGTKLDGAAFDLASLKGKVVLVDFWATWCGPCLREHPNIEANYKKFHDKGFEVVGISLDRNRAQLEAHVKKSETPWIILHEEGGKSDAARHYGVFGIPSMFLLDKEGRVVSTTARGPALGRELAALLGEPEEAAGAEEKSTESN
ncbi:MAG: TlpA family protein disulfide reductase [Planctomycetales bacterium]|nr:TlpA family protein disulfide reductase [Planctomycetales bacterium]